MHPPIPGESQRYLRFSLTLIYDLYIPDNRVSLRSSSYPSSPSPIHNRQPKQFSHVQHFRTASASSGDGTLLFNTSKTSQSRSVFSTWVYKRDGARACERVCVSEIGDFPHRAADQSDNSCARAYVWYMNMSKSAKPSQFLCHETGKNFFLEHTTRTRFFLIFIPYIIRGNSWTSKNGFVTPF